MFNKFIPLYSSLVKCYTVKFIVSTSYIGGSIRGIIMPISDFTSFVIYKDYFNVSFITYQSYIALATSAWGIKPLIAIIMDSVSLHNYHRLSYMLLFVCILVILLVISLIISLKLTNIKHNTTRLHNLHIKVPIEHNTLLYMYTTCYFLINLCTSSIDLLNTSVHNTKIIEVPNVGSVLISWNLMIISIFSVLTILLIGPLEQAHLIYVLYIIGLVLTFTLIYPIVYNWIEDKAISSSSRHDSIEDTLLINKEEQSSTTHKVRNFIGLLKTKEAIGEIIATVKTLSLTYTESDNSITDLNTFKARVQFCSILVASTAIVLAILSVANIHDWYRLFTLIALFIVTVLLNVIYLPKTISCINIYLYLFIASFFSTEGAMSYFYTSKCENMPRFDYVFYHTVTHTVSFVPSILGAIIYPKVLVKRNIRFLFIMSTFVRVLGALFDVTIVKRWNLTYLEIPDKALFLIGATVFPMCDMFLKITIVSLVSKVVLVSMESTILAYIFGFSNIAMSTSTLSGLILSKYMNVEHSCSVHNLSKLIIISHAIIPLSIIPFIFILLPNTRLLSMRHITLNT